MATLICEYQVHCVENSAIPANWFRNCFQTRFPGRQLSYIYKIEEWAVSKKLFMRANDGPFPMETTYIWQAIDDNTTRMKFRNQAIPTEFSKLFAPFMSLMIRKANKKDLQRLKALLESGNP